MNPQEYSLNIRPGAGYAQTVKVSQGDVGRPLRFNLLDGAKALGIQTGTAITIHGTKPSGLGFTETCTWSGSAASVTTTLEMTQENGTFPAELVLTLSNEVIGTANFMMNVERSPHDENTIDGTYDVADSIFARMDTIEEGLDATNAEVEQLAASVPTVDATLTVSGAAADAKKTGDEITQLKSDLTEVQDVLIEKTSTSLVNNADDVGSGPMANTRRWFLPYVIPANSKIANIAYHTASSVSGTIIFEVWKIIGTELTLDKSVEHTPVASSVNTVGINYISTSDVMIGWRIVGGTNIRQRGSTSFNMWASTDLQSTTLSTSSLDKIAFTTYTPCITVPYDTTKVVDFFQLPNNVITIGGGMDYEEIQDALLGITDDSATNPYTFILMPKDTPYKPFTMIRDSFSDAYHWSGKSPRHISIIGLDREHCVIQSDSGDYKHPCGEPLTNGVIKNIKFVMTNNEQTETATQGGYCLHIDSKTLNDVGYKMIIEDCDFEDASGPCLGIGVHANCDLQIRRCRFNTTLSANYNPHEGYTNLVDYGAVFCHTSTADIAPNQKFTLEDCVGVCAEGDKALRINVTAQYNPSTSSFVYTLLRNVFWNKTLNASGYQISASLTANPMNYGNNNA